MVSCVVLSALEDFVVGRPRGPWGMGGKVEEWGRGGGWFERGVEGTAGVLRVEADGVLIGTGSSSLGIVVGGRRASEYTSRRMSERPIIAAGWSAKYVSADSKWANARYGAFSATARCPRCNGLARI